MEAREKLNEFAELRGWNKTKLIGWSEAADFGEWLVKNNDKLPLVSRSLLLKIEKDLGDTKRQFLLWHDGGEWIVSLNGDMKQCKTLSELVCRNDG